MLEYILCSCLGALGTALLMDKLYFNGHDLDTLPYYASFPNVFAEDIFAHSW